MPKSSKSVNRGILWRYGDSDFVSNPHTYRILKTLFNYVTYAAI